VRNIPVDIARDLCADVVIVVNLVEPSVPADKLQTATQLLSRSNGVMIEANEKLQLQTLTPDDVLINVQMGDITTSDFERVPETVPLGEAAARAAAGRLAVLSVPVGQYQAWRARVTSKQEIEARLADVRYEGLEHVNPGFLEQRAEVRAGDVVDTEAISKEAQRMSALQDLESVEYRIAGEPDNPTLEWLPREKRWGPNYLKFDLGMYGSVGGDLAFVLYGKHTRTWVNDLGAEWRNELQVGYENLFATSLYQPLDVSQRFFIEPRVRLSTTWEDIFVDGDRLAKYRYGDITGGLDVGMNIGTRAQARVGYLYDHRRIIRNIGSPLLPEDNHVDAGVLAQFTYDTRDTPFNPTRGLAAAVDYIRSDDSLGADEERDWERLEAGLGMAVPVRNDVVWMTLAGGSDIGSELPADRVFTIGGPGSFPGYELGELRARSYWTAAGSYLWKIRDILTIRGQALYAGLRLEAGLTNDRIDIVDDEMTYGASLYLTGRTIAGPLTLGAGATTTDSWSLWIAVGRPVGHGTILERGIFR
jgi:NTE family protein